MKVATLMNKDVITCRAMDFLDVPARLMWEHDLGCLPVLNDEGYLTGIITDRDICMAAYTRGEPLASIPVALVMSHHVFACHPDDALDEAARRMRQHQVRRMPVVNGERRPIGMISLNDIARFSTADRETEHQVASTLAAISAPRSALALRPPA